MAPIIVWWDGLSAMRKIPGKPPRISSKRSGRCLARCLSGKMESFAGCLGAGASRSSILRIALCDYVAVVGGVVVDVIESRHKIELQATELAFEGADVLP